MSVLLTASGSMHATTFREPQALRLKRTPHAHVMSSSRLAAIGRLPRLSSDPSDLSRLAGGGVDHKPGAGSS